jgi:hypothetical protein
VATWIHNTLEKGKELIAMAQEQKEQNVNVYQRPVDFRVKNKVYVSTKNWKTQWPSQKLDNQIAGPFDITKQIGNLYKVKLSDTMKIYNVFSPDRLWKATDDPLPGQVNNLALSIIINSDKE